MNPQDISEDETVGIQTITHSVVDAKMATFSFVLGGVQFSEGFCIHNCSFSADKLGDIPVIGILGNTFMRQHRLVIDYGNFTFHTSNVKPDEIFAPNCDFYFPMEEGFEKYDLPLFTMRQNGQDLVILADTGAGCNAIASSTLADNGFRFRNLDVVSDFSGLADSVEVGVAMVNFNILSPKDVDKQTISRYDVFKIPSDYILNCEEAGCDEDDNQLPPVEALVGSSFMAREKWVLDFGAKIIYKRKTILPWNDNTDINRQSNQKRRHC